MRKRQKSRSPENKKRSFKEEIQSCNMDDLQEIRSNILDELSIIDDLLTNKERSMGKVQKSILLKKRANSIIIHFNKLAKMEDISTEQSSKLLEEFIHPLASILYQKWPVGDYQEVYYNIAMIRAMCICNLMEAWGEEGKLRITGTANALADLVTGVKLADVESLLPEFDHPGYLRVYSLVFNYLNMFAGMYYIASCQIYTIDYSFLADWTDQAIQGNQRFLNIVENPWSDFEALYRKLKSSGQIQTFYANLGILLATITQMMRYLIILDSRFSGKWPQNLHDVEFLDTTSHFTVINSLTLLQKKIDLYKTKLDEIIQKRIINPNDHPYQDPILKNGLEAVDLNELVLSSISTIDHYLKQKIAFKNEIKTLTSRIFTFLDTQENNFRNPQYLNSAGADYFTERARHLVVIIGLHTILTKHFSVFSELEQKLGLFLEKQGITRHPLFVGFLMQVKVAILLNLQKVEQFPEISTKLNGIVQHLNYYPRDATSYFILGQLIQAQEVSSLLMKEKMKSYLKNHEKYIHSTIYNTITNYIDSLGNPSFNWKQITPFASDPVSILIPDFQAAHLENTFPNHIQYIPFNLATHYVVDNTRKK